MVTGIVYAKQICYSLRNVCLPRRRVRFEPCSRVPATTFPILIFSGQ